MGDGAFELDGAGERETGDAWTAGGWAARRADADSAAEATWRLAPFERGFPLRDAGAPLELRIEEPAPAPARLVRIALGETLLVGRGEGCDVRLVDATVSRRHARVEHVGRGLEVRDEGGANGVGLGSARAPLALVPEGGEFCLGRVRVSVAAAAPAGPAPCRAAGDAPGADEDPDADAEIEAPLRGLVGGSRAMRRLASAVRRVAPLRLGVLVRGETGTGKELVARALHDESPRRAGPFVALSCATISRELAESELFGHLRGAFTGATRERRGAFREAHRGTLFLDEIGALPPDMQAKLLRVVEEGSVRPLGAEASVPVDVRLVTATCEPLEEMVAARLFRADLYERLAACVVRVPPLRRRPEDVGPLARHLLATSGLEGRTLTPGAVARLKAHRFPGNVRELRNVVVQAALRARVPVLEGDVAAALAERAGAPLPRLGPNDALRFYEQARGNVSEAARRAELPRSTMRDLLRAAGVRPRQR